MVGCRLVAIAAVVAVTMPLALASLFGPPRLGREGRLGGAGEALGRVALVVAHPDDEAMFFWPTLLQLQDAGLPLSVLCLSTGNFDGLGTTRRLEMERSCAQLGVAGEDLVILDVEGLQDGWRLWSEDLVAKHVLDFVQDRGAAIVLTFDEGGVSGHPNHVSTSRGVQRARDGKGAAMPFEVLLLDTVGLPRKYLGAASQWTDAFLDDSSAATCTWRHPLACLRALSCHWSQLVWYRILFTLFSRYSYVNTYTRYASFGEEEPSAVAAAAPPARQPTGSDAGRHEEPGAGARRRR